MSNGNAMTATIQQALVAASLDALLAISPEGDVLSWNEGARSMFGFASDDAVGRPFAGLFNERGDERTSNEIKAAIHAAVVSGTARLQMSATKQDGSVLDIDVSMKSIHDDNGKVRFLTVIQRDVTQLKRLLDESQGDAKLRGLLEAAPDAMIIVDREGRIIL